MKVAQILVLLCGALQVLAQDRSAILTVELYDDNTEGVTLQSSGLVAGGMWDAVAAAAGCLPGTQQFNGFKLTCRHAVERSGPMVSASWNFAPLANSLSALGATSLTTCVYHPDWPYSENNQNLPVQHIPNRTAYCGGWAPTAAGPLQVTVKAGYGWKAAEMVGLAALLVVVIAGGAGMLLRMKGILLRHSLITLWMIAGFGWLTLLLRLDGLRLLSLWFGFAGDGRWLCAGLAAWVPLLILAVLFARRDPLLSKWTRRNALLSAAVFVLVTLVLGGASQVNPVELTPYLVGGFVVLLAARSRVSKGLTIAAASGELLANFTALAAKAKVRMPKLMLWNNPPGSLAIAAAVIGRPTMILISTNLLKACSKREVDAIAAHELAHFRQGRRWILILFLLGMGGILVWAASVEQRLQFWAMLPASIVGLLLSACKRRLEFAADRFSAQLTGDPQAMAGALVKLGAINQTPLCGSALREVFLTHPWTEKRVQRLGVSLADAESSPSTPAYTADALAAEATPNRPMAVLLRTLVQFVPFLQARIWLVAILAGLCDWLLHPATMVSSLLFLAAVSGGFFGISAWWARRLKQAAVKVRASALDLHGSGWTEAPLCGMAPGIGHTIFDSGYAWDMGLVRISGGALCYAGDRASFALQRAAINGIDLLPGPPVRWKRSQAICIRLRSGTPASIALNVFPDSADARTQLLEVLRRWHQDGEFEPRTPCDFASIESVSWPQGQIVRKRVLSVKYFSRLLFAAAVLPQAGMFLWAWNRSSSLMMLPSAVGVALICLFFGRGVVLTQDALVAQKTSEHPMSRVV